MLPKKLSDKIDKREEFSLLRNLGDQDQLIDFSSNDYLGFAKSESIFEGTHQFLIDNNAIINGATGSRLLTGNHRLYFKTEEILSQFHNSEAALIFNSGYNANIGFFSSVPQKGDIIFYDEFIHASIREGMQLSKAIAYKFKHNNLKDLEEKMRRLFKKNDLKGQAGTTTLKEIYIVTESVFSMDGDSPDLTSMTQICQKTGAHLIVDEAHALGVFGRNGVGLLQDLGLEHEVFARIITFGKALGSHGAAILGSTELKQYLINFARSFIYTTGLPPHTLATVKTAYEHLALQNMSEESSLKKLHRQINFFNKEVNRLQLQDKFIKSNSTIQCCLISGNKQVKKLAAHLQNNGFDVKPILSPTIPEGQERLRFCLHSYNSEEEIEEVLQHLATFVK